MARSPGSTTRSGRKTLATKNKAIKQARIEQSIELQIKGVPTQDVATLLNVDKHTIKQWNKRAEEQGLVEGVRARIMDQILPKAINVYEEILSTAPEILESKQLIKAQELRLKAARDVAHGTGALRKEASSLTAKRTQTIDLDEYMKLREAKLAHRTPIGGEIVEGELNGSHGEQRSPDEPTHCAEEGGRGLSGDGEGAGGEVVVGGDGAGSDPSSSQGDGCDVQAAPAGAAGPSLDEGRAREVSIEELFGGLVGEWNGLIEDDE